MASNFLGDASTSGRVTSSILSMTELMAREGINLQKGMNYRDDGVLLSVFLVLPTHNGEYTDAYNASTGLYEFEGHDSTTVEAGGKAEDQLMMYESGRLTDNGKFYKAAHAFIDGLAKEALRIQVYEKLDAGVWFDKGIFELVGARRVERNARKVFLFDLRAIGVLDGALGIERMLSVSEKLSAWERDKGRCAYCEEQEGLRFVEAYGETRVVCALHRGESVRSGLLG